MPTRTKPRKTNKPAEKATHGFPRARRGTSERPTRRPSLPGRSPKPSVKRSPSLIGRAAQASLPGRKPRRKKSGRGGSALNGIGSSLTSVKDGASARKPSNRGLIGIVAGAGLGATAVAKRRRAGKRDETTDGATTKASAQPASAGRENDVPAAA